MSKSIETQAIALLKQAYGHDAEFRDGQLEAIISVVQKEKTLVVQKTGWGKSIVYFIATKILRQNGAGPTIIVSPLLALMKNQIDSALVLNINAVTINSDNKDDWEYIYDNLNSYDALIISPERLSNEKFIEHLSNIRDIQLFVVDEAHSISDWGHDFRPDYQRIVKLLENFPDNIAILGTTATANNRVIADIKKQLGDDLVVVRGDLIREKLAIQVNPNQSREERLAWLAQSLSLDEKLKEGQGIIYCLTQRDCETVANFLQKQMISAEAYHSGLGKDENGNNIAQLRMDDFDNGKIRILVATIKLGMGYDKSDIRFVIHYQLPQNLISYYQQIGRAGRDGELAYAILLHGNEDEEILDYFIENAQASPELLNDIMNLTLTGAKLNQLMTNLNVRQTKLKEALKYLLVHEYIYKDHSTYRRNVASTFDSANESVKQKTLNDVKHEELKQLKQYLKITECHMKFVAEELDAPDVQDNCRICANCVDQPLIQTDVLPKKLILATEYLRNKHGKILPRKKWATGGIIKEEIRMKEGWTLSDDYYSEIGQKVKAGKYDYEHFSDKLVEASKEYIEDKVRIAGIDMVLAVPSLRRPTLVPDFASKLSSQLAIPFENAIQKTSMAHEQKKLLNSVQQQENIRQSITIDKDKVFGKTILLVDDMVDSRWSFTVIAAELLSAGANAVYPFALVKTGS